MPKRRHSLSYSAIPNKRRKRHGSRFSQARQGLTPYQSQSRPVARNSLSAASSRGRARGVGTRSKRQPFGNNNLNNATRFKKVGKIATRHRKRVHIDPKFRAKVKGVLLDKGTQGTRVQIYNDYFKYGNAVTSGVRHFKFDHIQAEFGVGFTQHVFFTPLQVMNSAAIMFNKKLPTIKYNTLKGNFGYFQAGGAQTEQEVTDSNRSNTVFEILSQKAEYVFTNNSKRHIAFTITVMTPKENTDVAVETTIDSSIAIDVAQLRWGGSATVGPSKDNLATNWQSCPTLKKYYKMEKTLIKMDPGASSSFTVHGYTGKFNWKNSIKQDQPDKAVHHRFTKNDTKFLVFDIVPSMVSVAAVTGDVGVNYAGRWVNASLPAANVLMSIRESITIQAPSIKPLNNNAKIDVQENYESSVLVSGRTFRVQNLDDEGDDYEIA